MICQDPIDQNLLGVSQIKESNLELKEGLSRCTSFRTSYYAQSDSDEEEKINSLNGSDLVLASNGKK